MTTELATTAPLSSSVTANELTKHNNNTHHLPPKQREMLMTSSQSWHPSTHSRNEKEAGDSPSSPVVPLQTQSSNTQHAAILADPNVKFPLENSWSYWFYKNEKTKSWKENVKFICTVDFVEDFWGVYNHIQLVSKISVGCDYMFFKKDIPPMWEDPQNCDGGRWVLNLDKKFKNSLDSYWLNTLLALIGDQFMDESPYVNGVWVNVRGKIDKIALWTKSAKDAEVQLKIGRKFKEILGLRDGSIIYEEHDEQKKAPEPLFKL